MDKKIILLILIICALLLVFYGFGFSGEYEGFDGNLNLSNEAIQNIASLYNLEKKFIINDADITNRGNINNLGTNYIFPKSKGGFDLESSGFDMNKGILISTESVTTKKINTSDINTKNLVSANVSSNNIDIKNIKINGLDIRNFMVPAYLFVGRDERDDTSNRTSTRDQMSMTKGGTPNILPLGNWKHFAGDIEDHINGVYVNPGFIVELFKNPNYDGRIRTITGPYHYKYEESQYDEISCAKCYLNNDLNGDPVWPTEGKIE
jgi:hypothetical protein